MIVNRDAAKWVIRQNVSDEVYTDREEFLSYFHHAALEAAHRRTMSTVLLGQRRMGKTEIFRRVVNRLFFEQDPKDPRAVVPVYYSFPDGPLDNHNFAVEYLENFMKYYVGFYARKPELVTEKFESSELLRRLQNEKSKIPFSRTFDMLLTWYGTLERGESAIPQKTVLEFPRRMADIDDSTIVMFLDEFQNTRLPQYDFEIVGFMQEAVESPNCPHFVTGSAMSILGREIIGRGSLFGRFRGREIKALSYYHGNMLAGKAARHYNANVSELMMPVIAEKCGGNPFYINAVIQQAAETGQPITDEESLNKALAVDISSGFIWGELNDQVTRWIHRINEFGITKWVLYLSVLDEFTDESRRDRLNIEEIQRVVEEREGKKVPLETIRDVLIKLSRGDLVEFLELGDWFRRVKDPILVEFLKVWGRIEVEGHDAGRVQDEIIERYQSFQRRVREYKGYLAEVHMSQVLLSSQNRTLPGKYFNSDPDIEMPWRFTYVRHRVRLESGRGKEMDVLGAAGKEKWICQSKWITGKKAGISVLKELAAQAELLKREMNPKILRLWLFAHDGLTGQAEAFAKKHGILWSARKEFDALLAHLGLRQLPEL